MGSGISNSNPDISRVAEGSRVSSSVQTLGSRISRTLPRVNGGLGTDGATGRRSHRWAREARQRVCARLRASGNEGLRSVQEAAAQRRWRGHHWDCGGVWIGRKLRPDGGTAAAAAAAAAMWIEGLAFYFYPSQSVFGDKK
jgi:hypothetical protein